MTSSSVPISVNIDVQNLIREKKKKNKGVRRENHICQWVKCINT